MRRACFLAGALAFSLTVTAHDAAQHAGTDLAASVTGDRPSFVEPGILRVPKATQRLLGIRTQPWDGAAVATIVHLAAEVVAQPASPVAVTAAEPGRLEAAARAWPLPGETVRAGEVLAWLQPSMTQRDLARRRTQIAELEQKLQIATLNVDRLRLQAAANTDEQAATGNIYFEQALAERDVLSRQRDLLADSLGDRVPLRARVDGVVLAVPGRIGDRVVAGQPIVVLDEPRRRRLVAVTFDPALGTRLRAAHVTLAGTVDLAFRGQEPVPAGPGWRLSFDAPAEALATHGVGEWLDVALDLGERVAWPDGACVANPDGGAQVWLHRAPERFVALALDGCSAAPPPLSRDERVVTRGADLLALYE